MAVCARQADLRTETADLQGFSHSLQPMHAEQHL